MATDQQKMPETFDGQEIKVSADVDTAWETHWEVDDLAELVVYLRLQIGFCDFTLEFRDIAHALALAEQIGSAVREAASEWNSQLALIQEGRSDA